MVSNSSNLRNDFILPYRFTWVGS